MNDASDQQEFLLRSLEDLEREHDAGDLDEADYQALRDDYTARAAATLRTEPASAGRRPPKRNRTLLVIAALLVFAAVAGVLVAQSSGRRDADDTATGSIDQSITQKLNDARRCFADADAECAVELYDEVLADRPDDAEALTYKGWVQYTLLDDPETALTTLIGAASAHPEYADVHAFLAVVFAQGGLLQSAIKQLDLLDALDPPPDLLAQIEGLREEIERQLAAATTSTTAG